MKPITKDCGCQIVDFDRDIEFCPMHKHAPLLMQALEKAIDTITPEFCSHKEPHGPTVKTCYANDLLAALLKCRQ